MAAGFQALFFWCVFCVCFLLKIDTSQALCAVRVLLNLIAVFDEAKYMSPAETKHVSIGLVGNFKNPTSSGPCS